MTKEFRPHVRYFGHGPRAALAIHCTLGHSGAWRGVGDALGDRLRLIAIDLPGHGKSARWDGENDLHQLCTDAALSQLPEPMDVIGHSFGATIALRLAVEHPHLVRSLALIEPVFMAAAIADAPERVKAHEVEAEPYFTALQSGDEMRAARLFNRFWGDGTKWDDIPCITRQYMADRMHLVPGQSPAIIDDEPGLLAKGALGRAHMPCLLIQGEHTADVIDAIHQSARSAPAKRAACHHIRRRAHVAH
ncbi:alpha/beta fold hydrolase [Roseobacter sp. EG26]|uniref:alpha/beta fold hydrolase n=1 Tax=Roseobacter sp. EG26 TaxID=3412477 RepID=UPI003CE52F2C